MAGSLKTVSTRLARRRCVSCGYDGALLRNGLADRCVRCGCDLYERPARSYAEMEGFVEIEPEPEDLTPSPPATAEEARTIERWLVLCLGSAILIVAAATLLAKSAGV
jgi:hypothetical protein